MHLFQLRISCYILLSKQKEQKEKPVCEEYVWKYQKCLLILLQKRYNGILLAIPPTTSIFSSSFSFFSFSFFLALAVMDRTAVETYHERREQRCFHRETIQWVCCRNDCRPPADRGVKTSARPFIPFSSQQQTKRRRNHKLGVCVCLKLLCHSVLTFSFSFSLGTSRAGG